MYSDQEKEALAKAVSVIERHQHMDRRKDGSNLKAHQPTCECPYCRSKRLPVEERRAKVTLWIPRRVVNWLEKSPLGKAEAARRVMLEAYEREVNKDGS